MPPLPPPTSTSAATDTCEVRRTKADEQSLEPECLIAFAAEISQNHADFAAELAGTAERIERISARADSTARLVCDEVLDLTRERSDRTFLLLHPSG